MDYKNNSNTGLIIVADCMLLSVEYIGNVHLFFNREMYKTSTTEEPGGICDRRRWTSLVRTSRFHPTPGYPPLPKYPAFWYLFTPPMAIPE